MFHSIIWIIIYHNLSHLMQHSGTLNNVTVSQNTGTQGIKFLFMLSLFFQEMEQLYFQMLTPLTVKARYKSAKVHLNFSFMVTVVVGIRTPAELPDVPVEVCTTLFISALAVFLKKKIFFFKYFIFFTWQCAVESSYL